MAKNRILIVEDDRDIAESIGLNLELSDFDYCIIDDGLAVVEHLKSDHSFDLALLDIMLPGLDGFALMEYMQKYNIPVLYLTARTDVPSRVRGLRDGAGDYIVKPFDPEELEARIGAILDRVDYVKQDTTQKLLQEESRLLDRVSRELQVPAELLVQELESTTCSFATCAPVENAKDSAKRLQQQIRELPWSITETPHTVPVHIQPMRIAPVIRGAAASVARIASERTAHPCQN